MMDSLTVIIAALSSIGQVAPPDPLGFPLPPWILQALAYLTLTLHFLAMNFTVGGVLLYLWTGWRKPPGHEGIGYFLGSGLPLGVSYLITLGVPPLLFVQVLYGQLFYSSSVVVGAFWIQVIPVMILAYTGFYYHKLTREKRPRGQRLVVGLAGLLLLYIGFIYVNNFTLTMSPDKLLGLYSEHPGGGVLIHGEPTLIPRFLLFIAGAFAAAGLAIIWRGVYLRRWGYAEEADASQRFGYRALLVTPVLWTVAAFGIFLTRPDSISVMWGETWATLVLLCTGVAGGATALVFARAAIGRENIVRPLIASLGLTVAVASMVIFRDLVRIENLRGRFELSTVPVNTQWVMFSLFVITLAAGVALLVVLFVRVFPNISERSRERMQNTLPT